MRGPDVSEMLPKNMPIPAVIKERPRFQKHGASVFIEGHDKVLQDSQPNISRVVTIGKGPAG